MTSQAAPGFIKHPDHPMELLPLDGTFIVQFDGVEIARSNAVISLKEASYPERLYFPLSSISADILVPTDKETYCPFKGTANYWDLNVNGQSLKDALWGYMDPYLECASIQKYGCFYTELGPFQITKVEN